MEEIKMAKIIKRAGLNLLATLWDVQDKLFWHQKITFEEVMAWGSFIALLLVFWIACNVIH
jgi:hypothetical protein